MGSYEPIIRIAELGNLTRAAEALGYSQSSLSYITNNIEKKLGVKLFHRERQGVTLTEAGVPLLEIMKRIEDLETQLLTTAMTRRTNLLRVGTVASMAAAWMPRLMQTFSDLYPETSLYVIQRDSYSDLLQGLQQEDFDCTFFVGSHSAAYDFHPLYEDPYYVALPADHPLAQEAELTVAQLAEYPFIPPSESLGYSPMSAVYNALTNRAPFFTNRAEDATVLKMVEEGLGFTISPGLLLVSLAPGRNLCIRPLSPATYRTIGILSRPHDELGEAAKAFLKLAKEQVDTWDAETPSLLEKPL